jgi:hypothetical protein
MIADIVALTILCLTVTYLGYGNGRYRGHRWPESVFNFHTILTVFMPLTVAMSYTIADIMNKTVSHQ